MQRLPNRSSASRRSPSQRFIPTDTPPALSLPRPRSLQEPHAAPQRLPPEITWTTAPAISHLPPRTHHRLYLKNYQNPPHRRPRASPTKWPHTATPPVENSSSTASPPPWRCLCRL